MKFLLFIHQHLTPEDVAALPEDERNALYAAWGAVNETPGVTPGQQLAPAPDARTVRGDGNGGAIVTDGPFAETKEAIGGYLFFEADDMDAAVELAGRVPAVLRGGAIEVRPIVESGWGRS
jgi:hypothetical protein